MIEWVKVDRAAVLAARTNRHADRPAEANAVLVELSALVADDQLQHKSLRALADEWGWNRGRLRRQLQRWLEAGALPWLSDMEPGKALEGVRLPRWFHSLQNGPREQKRTTSEPLTDHERTTQPEVFRGDTATRGPRTDHERTTSGPFTRALPIDKTKTKTEKRTPPGRVISDAWVEAYRYHFGSDYVFVWKGAPKQRLDGTRIARWLATAQGDAALVVQAVELYQAECARGLDGSSKRGPFPYGDPPTTDWFDRDHAKWLSRVGIRRTSRKATPTSKGGGFWDGLRGVDDRRNITPLAGDDR